MYSTYAFSVITHLQIHPLRSVKPPPVTFGVDGGHLKKEKKHKKLIPSNL